MANTTNTKIALDWRRVILVAANIEIIVDNGKIALGRYDGSENYYIGGCGVWDASRGLHVALAKYMGYCANAKDE